MSNTVETFPSLELLVLQHHGQDVDYVWTCPAHITECGLDKVLEGLGSADPGLLTMLRSCILQRMGSQQPIWVLGNTSPRLACSVNRKRLTLESHVRLDHGDEIEVALTRMVVSLAPAQDSTASVLLQAVEQPERVQSLSPANDPLHDLHTRYLEKLKNPHQADMAEAWQDMVRSAQAEHIDPLQKWMDAAASQPTLGDLLQPLRSMEQLVQGMDTLSSKDLLAPESFENILQLFAPEQLRQQVKDAVRGLPQGALPELTQREHHTLSLDSAMPFIGGKTPPATDA